MSYQDASHGRYDGALPEGFLSHVERHLAEFGLPLTRSPDGLHAQLSASEVDLRLGEAGFSLSIAAHDRVHLYQTRESVLYLLDQVFPEASDRIAWSGAAPVSEVPPNFHLAVVRSVRRVGARFLRVEMDCEGVEALSVGGMHFSLLLPPKDRAPVWPRVSEKGRTVWPEGADAIHRVGYTFVEMDAAQGRFSFDVYEHEGGQTTDWARAAQPGEQVAVMGPGGGDFPPGAFILMVGDETALPAIRRILETSEPSRRGVALIEIGDPGDRLEFAHPDGVAVEWILRGDGPALWERLAAVKTPALEGDVYVWVAGEQALARKAKAHFRDAGLPRAQGYFSAYWIALEG